MSIQNLIESKVKEGFFNLYQIEIPTVEFQATRKEFEGDITVVVFPLLRYKKGNPVQIGEDLGNYIVENVTEITRFNVVKGFLNLVVSDTFYNEFFNTIYSNALYGFVSPKADEKAIMVEYSSPNTNKPLHLGHVRNNLLGYAVSEILKASGKKVYKTQIINDRGVHICKSMLAWQKYGNGETPESTGLKGDKLVGNYYVKFEQEFQNEYSIWLKSDKGEKKYLQYKENSELERISLWNKIGENYQNNKEDFFSDCKIRKEFRKNYKDAYFNNYSNLGNEVKLMLQEWEGENKEVVSLWKTMNSWVYSGFEVTYKNMGVNFDTLYYESDTYLLGKDVVAQGLEKGVFYKKDDGSVWCDLTADGLDEKIVLRSDGTAVYMTQDIGTAIQRVKDYSDVGGMVYTVGNEQDYHFQVLFLILKKLGFDWAKQLHHLSYGMVDLPSGKMKSREGTVVDADDLMVEMTNTAKEISEELGKLDGYSVAEKEDLYQKIGLGALKYFVLKVDPKKRILFDPKSSVDFQGNTGPFIQYTYARIQSIIRKAEFDYSNPVSIALHEKEKELLKQLELFPETIQQAAANYSPAIIANYTYDLVKEFNSFYQNVSILGEEDPDKKTFRVQLAKKVADTIKLAFSLLGIEVPERM
ncbi:arginine--tRNA ligase [Polaribacter litorisediminis]|uniref:arginine--tRNA ligase n=1 Tax=Polaribacter litorisediminis TaxID=1908341 RepID=UPI001CBB0ADC|nr:arginine--tRNA ligase [Polaribacter litorisediminis]UAM96732.1 arginine--tRNA ligase [Polaribacter litorisediminis]